MLKIRRLQAVRAAGRSCRLAHITGGGLTEKLPRVLPDILVLGLIFDSWELPVFFKWMLTLAACLQAENAQDFQLRSCRACSLLVKADEGRLRLTDRCDRRGRGNSVPMGASRITTGRLPYTGACCDPKRALRSFFPVGGSNLRALFEDMTATHPARPLCRRCSMCRCGRDALGQRTGHCDEFVGNIKTFCRDRAALKNELDAPFDAPFRRDSHLPCGFHAQADRRFYRCLGGRDDQHHPSLFATVIKVLHTHGRALESDTQHGCTVQRRHAALDDGPILAKATISGYWPATTPDESGRRGFWCQRNNRLYPAVLRRFASGNAIF